MVCNKCNQNIEDDSKFCSFCGNKIENNTNEIEVDQKDTNLKEEVTQTKMGFYDFYLNHKGSIGRQEFFFRGFLPLSIINLILLIGIKISSSLIIYSNFYKFLTFGLWVISIFIFVIISNITVKRLHDMNSKSWFFIWNLVPFINIIVLLSLLSTPSSKIRNHGQKSYYKLCILRITIAILQIILIFMLMFVYSYLEKNSKIIFYKDVKLSGVEKDIYHLKNLPSQRINESTIFLNATINKKI